MSSEDLQSYDKLLTWNDGTGSIENPIVDAEPLINELDLSSNQINPIPNAYHCNYCQKWFLQKRKFRRHMLTHSKIRHQCEHCTNSYKDKCNLAKHVNLVHNLDEQKENAYTCHACKISFSSKHDLVDHRKLHIAEGLYDCDKCEKMFSNKSALKRHIESHSESKYQCKICLKYYKRKDCLNRHSKSHLSGTREFSCGVCNNSFTEQSQLISHMREHLDNQELHKCNECEKTYKSKYELVHHMKIHSGLRHQCTLCPKIIC